MRDPSMLPKQMQSVPPQGSWLSHVLATGQDDTAVAVTVAVARGVVVVFVVIVLWGVTVAVEVTVRTVRVETPQQEHALL